MAPLRVSPSISKWPVVQSTWCDTGSTRSSDVPAFDAVTEFVDHAGAISAGDAGQFDLDARHAAPGKHVEIVQAAGFDFQPDPARCRLGQRKVSILQNRQVAVFLEKDRLHSRLRTHVIFSCISCMRLQNVQVLYELTFEGGDMLKRFALAVAVLLAAGSASYAQPKRVAIAGWGPHPTLDEAIAGFKKGLAEGGFPEGTGVVFDESNVNFDAALVPQMLTRLSGARPDLMATIATPVSVASRNQLRTRTFPVVFCRSPIRFTPASCPRGTRATG